MKRLILYVLMMTSLVGCGTKSENKDYSENRRDSQNQENGFVDYNDVFHSFKEVDQAKKDYLKQIKKGDFINAITTEEWLWEYQDRNGLTSEEVNTYHNNHNALILLSEIEDRLNMAEEKKELYYEVEILPKLEELNSLSIDTKEIINQIKYYEKRTDDVFNTISKEVGEKRHSERNTPRYDGNEDFDNNGNYIEGGEDVGQWKSSDSVKSTDDVYGSD